ncbi:hypothetical protein DXB06_01365 [Butyricicoccus sp. OF13-6]|nr:hypothetical protein DXB06_01365 [Butyricicoccus sp. OF13-6]
MTFREECALSAFYFARKAVSRVQTVREMIPEYKRNLDRLRQRRLDLLREREFEPSFERRYKLTERIVRLNKIIASSSAALHDMMEYDHG